MLPLIIIIAYLVVGIIVAAIAKYVKPKEFAGCDDFGIMVVLFWPTFLVIGIGWGLGKMLTKVINGVTYMVGMMVEAGKSAAETRLPRIRWKD